MKREMEDNAHSPAQKAAALEELLQPRALKIEPNCCPLGAPLAITMRFALTAPVAKAFWTITYEADISAKRHLIPLLTTQPPRDLEPGEHLFQESVPGIRTEGVKEKHLLQVGMVKLELRSAASSGAGGDALVTVNLVTQVSKGEDGTLTRNVMSPLEEDD